VVLNTLTTHSLTTSIDFWHQSAPLHDNKAIH